MDKNKVNKKGVPSKNLSRSKESEDTSWTGVADWYNTHLSGKKTYHETLVYPNLVRLLGDTKGKTLLDLACGQGIFSHKLAESGAKVIGVDLGKDLIAIAKKINPAKNNPDFFVSPSDNLYMIQDKSVDIVIISLAIQNIEKVKETFIECARVIKDKGRLLIVMNHPAFRNPKQTAWGYDEQEGKQYRRVEEYLSESKIKIDMTPGNDSNKKFTISFHRPLQYYVKMLEKSNFLIKRLEEWESDRDSERGPRQQTENKARKEIPLFLMIEAVQWSNE